MSLLVSIHDVTPALRPGVERLWSLCSARGIVPALLVVPDWHGQWPLEQYPEFVAWLRDRAADGAEVVLHGERHDEVGLRRTWRDHLRGWGRTAGEGEFLTLDFEPARERIARGVVRLQALGLTAVGFVPPAWLARPEGHRAAGACGLRFSEDQRYIHRLLPGGSVRSPVVRWSARTAPRAWGSVVVAAARWCLRRRAAVVRIALHPPDVAHPATLRSVELALDRWPRVHRPVRYADVA